MLKSMNQTIHISNVGNVTLTDKNYIAAGGQGQIFKVNNMAVKIYHDKTKMIPEDKIIELSKISSKYVLKPINIAYSKNAFAGFTMDFLPNSNPICKLFTKAYKTNNNISIQDIVELVKHMQKTVQEIHDSECLIVDLNEMNLMVPENNHKEAYFIDVDSFQTKHHRATAIMDSIRDRTIKNNQWSILSDWYSFSIIAFQLYIGIHPYKGSHPKYKPAEWQKRMDDNVSVFDKSVSLPSVCNPFTVIPSKMLDWMKDVYMKNDRSIPPDIDASVPIVVPDQIITIQGNETFEISDIFSFKDHMREVYEFFGVKYFISDRNIYKDGVTIREIPDKPDKIALCASYSHDVIVCTLKNSMLKFEKLNGEIISSIKAKSIMIYDNIAYAIMDDGLYENTFKEMNGRLFHSLRKISNVSELTTQAYPGVIYQNLLSRHYMTVPVGPVVFAGDIVELSGHRILSMKRCRNIIVVISECNKEYVRTVLKFKESSFKFEYECRVDKDIDFDDINMAVLVNGIVILQVDGGKIQIFKEFGKVKEIEKVPFSSDMQLKSFGNSVYLMSDKNFYILKLK